MMTGKYVHSRMRLASGVAVKGQDECVVVDVLRLSRGPGKLVEEFLCPSEQFVQGILRIRTTFLGVCLWSSRTAKMTRAIVSTQDHGLTLM